MSILDRLFDAAPWFGYLASVVLLLALMVGFTFSVALNRFDTRPVFVLLYAIAMVASGFTGYSAGLAGRPRHVPSIVVVVLIAVVIGLVSDIDRPTQGYVTVSQKPMLDLMAGFTKSGP